MGKGMPCGTKNTRGLHFMKMADNGGKFVRT